MKLDIKKSEEICKKTYEKIKDPFDKEFHIIHSKKVGEMAVVLSEFTDTNLKKDFFLIVGWIHDIGYVIDVPTHPEQSIKILEQEGFEVDEVMKDCILNHTTTGNPKTKEGKIVQLADKLSIFDEDTVRIYLRNNKNKIKEEDIQFFENMSKNAVNLLRSFNLEK